MYFNCDENKKDITVYAVYHKWVRITDEGDKIETVGIEDICDCESSACVSIDRLIRQQDERTHINNPYMYDRTIENGVITFVRKAFPPKCSIYEPWTHVFWYEKAVLKI